MHSHSHPLCLTFLTQALFHTFVNLTWPHFSHLFIRPVTITHFFHPIFFWLFIRAGAVTGFSSFRSVQNKQDGHDDSRACTNDVSPIFLCLLVWHHYLQVNIGYLTDEEIMYVQKWRHTCISFSFLFCRHPANLGVSILRHVLRSESWVLLVLVCQKSRFTRKDIR